MKYKTLVIILTALCLIFAGMNVAAAASMKEEYDEQGNVIKKSYYRDDDSLEQVEKYDKYGHKIGVGYYGSDGKLRENADGWAAIRWKYKNGKIIGEGYYSADGRLKELKQYNELGDLIAKRYVGGSGPNPSEEFNPVPPLAGETNSYYDSYGRPEGSTSIVSDPGWFPELWLLDDRADD